MSKDIVKFEGKPIDVLNMQTSKNNTFDKISRKKFIFFSKSAKIGYSWETKKIFYTNIIIIIRIFEV